MRRAVLDELWHTDVFEQADVRADLALLAASTAQESRRFAADAQVLARLARRVPRAAGDHRDATPWTSFLREVAVARRCSDAWAADQVRTAVHLVTAMPSTLSLLASGALPVAQARALVHGTITCQPATTTAVDAQLAERACALPVWRVRQAVRRLVLRLDADAVAVRAAKAAAARGVRLVPLEDDQAQLSLTGPAVGLAQGLAALTAHARALQATGDPRGLDALRYDLALHALIPTAPATPPLAAPPPHGATGTGGASPNGAASRSGAPPTGAPGPGAGASPATGAATSPPAPPPATGVLGPVPTDRRCTRPVRIDVTVPVQTALGLSHEPGWLPGYGWLSAPTCRQLLPSAELRKICVTSDTGQVIDIAPGTVRPLPTPPAVQAALRDLVMIPTTLTDAADRVEPQHDPSHPLADLVRVRDRTCDGPTGAHVPARRADLDHETAWPTGPTAAWNLVARGRRTHLLKHRGWTPLRTSDSTLWFSPAGQLVQVPHHHTPPPELEPDAQLPDPNALHALEAEQARPPDPDDHPPFPF